MNLKVEKNDEGKGELELNITIPFVEQKKYLESAAHKLSGKKPIKGFRPGKAPYEVMERTFGGDVILNEALEELIQASYYQVIKNEKISALGSPQINITKQAYENDLVYKALVSLVPEVSLGNISEIKIKAKKVNVPDEEVLKALEDFRKMRAVESEVKRAAAKGDLVEVDFSTKIDKVEIENGSAKKYPLVLGDGQMIPGFEDEIVGLKSGEEKKFKLKFPSDYKKDLAGKEADFEVKVLTVKERKLPELNDDFAKGLGQGSLADLKKLMRANIEAEAKRNEEQVLEVEMLQAVIKKSTFGPIPNSLIHNEIHRITHEIESDLKNQGIKYSDYLKNLGKSNEEFEKDLEPKALDRVKSALVSREIAIKENIKAEQAEIDQEINLARLQYKNNPEVLENLNRPEYKEYLANVLANRKVIDWLKKKIVE